MMRRLNGFYLAVIGAVLLSIMALPNQRLYAFALPASDSFPGGNVTNSLGANWSNQDASNPMGVFGNQAYTTTFGSYSTAFWNADIFAADQYSQVTSVVATDGVLVLVRATGTSRATTNYYAIAGDPGGSSIVIVQSGTMTVLHDFSPTGPQNGDVVRLEVVGSTLTYKINGSTIGTATDSVLTSGAPGIGSFSTTGRLDNWSGGNLGAGTGTCLLMLLGAGC